MRLSRSSYPKVHRDLERSFGCDSIPARFTQRTSSQTRSPLDIDRPNSREIGFARLKTAYIDPKNSDSNCPLLSKGKGASRSRLEAMEVIPSHAKRCKEIMKAYEACLVLA